MKYIYVVPFNGDYEIGINKRPYLMDTKFKAYRYKPTSKVSLKDIASKLNIALIQYLPEDNILNDELCGLNSYIIRYTNNKHILKVEWFKCIISSYTHIKNLESFGLIRIDKRTYRKMDKVLRDIEAHNELHPELWV